MALGSVAPSACGVTPMLYPARVVFVLVGQFQAVGPGRHRATLFVSFLSMSKSSYVRYLRVVGARLLFAVISILRQKFKAPYL